MSAELEARIEVPAGHRLGRRALSLGAANALDYAFQFLLPVVLVRFLDTAAFGQYRLLGLEVGTVMAVVTMAIPGSLYYFLPRSEGATKRLYINQALVFLAAAGLLYGLRSQADQWVAAALFSVGMFASFSIATVLGPLVHLCRQSVFHTVLPSLSRLQAAGDIRGMLKLNSRASVMVGALLYPLLAFAFVFAEEIVTIIYTAAYADAVPVMRVFIVGFAGLVVDLGSTMLVLRQGAYMMRVSLVTLVVSVALSWFSAHAFGLAGAAMGSVTVVYIDYVVILRHIAVCTGIPVRQLQDWRTLGLLILFAALAAAIALSMTDRHVATGGPLVRLVFGGLLLAAVYTAMAALAGVGRGWLAAIRNSRDDP